MGINGSDAVLTLSNVNLSAGCTPISRSCSITSSGGCTQPFSSLAGVRM